MVTPAVVRLDDRMDKLKFPIKCSTCKKQLVKGELVFFSKPAGYKYWHSQDLSDGSKCYEPAWKAAGTSYEMRKNIAINHAYQKDKMSDLNPFKEKIRLALRRFRLELTILSTEMKLEPSVYKYLIDNKLIAENTYEDKSGKICSRNSYVIVPKGFNWDTDLGQVRMPTPATKFDENGWGIDGEDVMTR